MSAIDLWHMSQRVHVTGFTCDVSLMGSIWEAVPEERRPRVGRWTGADAPCVLKPAGDAFTVNLSALGISPSINIAFSRGVRLPGNQLRLTVDDRTPQPLDGGTIRHVHGQITLRLAELPVGDPALRETVECPPGMTERRRIFVRAQTVPQAELPLDQPNTIRFEGDLGAVVVAADVTLTGLAGVPIGALPPQPRVARVRLERRCLTVGSGSRIPVHVALDGVVEPDHVPGVGYLPVSVSASWDVDPGVPGLAVTPAEVRIPAGRSAGSCTLSVPAVPAANTVTVTASTDGGDHRSDQLTVAPFLGGGVNPCQPVMDYRPEPPIFDPCLAADCWLVGLQAEGWVVAVRHGMLVRARPDEVVSIASLPERTMWARVAGSDTVVGALLGVDHVPAGFVLGVASGKLVDLPKLLPVAVAADGRLLGYAVGSKVDVPAFQRKDEIEVLSGFEDVEAAFLAGMSLSGDVFGTVRLADGAHPFRWGQGFRKDLELPGPGRVVAVSDSGCVAGTLGKEARGALFFWSDQAGYRPVDVGSEGTAYATGVSDDGVVTVVALKEGGDAVDARSWAWHPDKGATELVVPGVEGLVAVSINGSGVILASGYAGGQRLEFRMLTADI